MTTQQLAIPALSSNVDQEVKRAIQALVQQFNGVLNGTITVGAASTISPSGGVVPSVVGGTTIPTGGTTIPTGGLQPVTNVVATGLFNTILVSWDDEQSRLVVAGYEVWRSTVDDLGSAIHIGYTTAKSYADTPSDTSTAIEYFYWIRPVGRDSVGTLGPFNAASGVNAHTANDPAFFHALLEAQILSEDLPDTLDEVFFQTPKFALIDPGSPAKVITSITRSGTTATVTCAAHGFLSGSQRVIAGALQPEYNGMKLITVVDADTFTYQIVSSVSTPATVAAGVSSIRVSGSTATVPFIVQDGTVYIDTAMIVDLTANKITSGFLAADRIEFGSLNGDKITGNTITADQIAGNTITTEELDFTIATSDNVIASINASTEGIVIEGARVEINSITTFQSGYNPNTAYNTATTAQSSANTAQSTANTAYNTANTAQSSANTAYNTANTAQSTAEGRILLGSAATDINNNTTTINGGNITARTIAADRIAASTLTVTEIYGLARINGNRLNVIQTGSVYLANDQMLTITHNLGRSAIVSTSPYGVDIDQITTTSFTIHNRGGGATVVYAYM